MLATDTRPAPGATSRRSGPSVWRQLDFVLVGGVVLLAAFGVVMVWSATRVPLASSGLPGDYTAKKQAIFSIAGVAVMLVMARIDYRRWKDWAPALYGLGLLALVAVFVVGRRVKGAQAWFQVGPYQLEPSEFVKITLIIGLAAYAARWKGHLPARAVAVILVLTAVPFVLVYKQPALGSALVLLAIAATVIVIGGARMRLVAALAAVAVLLVAGVLQLGILKGYQRARITSFVNTPNVVNPSLLQTVAGANIYNLVESKNAISHGGLLGQGIGKGSATNLSQVPSQQTDFIFSAAGEQVGLVGCALLLGLFLLVLWRTWLAAAQSRDLFGTLVCVGVLGMLAFQIFENIGMAMGMMPVAGIPLPWMSYGGSAVIVEFVVVGLVLSVRMRRVP